MINQGIDEFKDKYEENLHDWNANISIFYNLEELLNIKLPKKSEDNSQVKLSLKFFMAFRLFSKASIFIPQKGFRYRMWNMLFLL